jgi:hypothetical protein
MREPPERKPANFVVTKGYRLFAEMCDACRQARFVGLGYGPPGVRTIDHLFRTQCDGWVLSLQTLHLRFRPV